MVGVAKASSIVVAGLESALGDIRRRHPDVPEAAIALAGSRRKWGHWAHKSWVRGEVIMDELFVSGEGLRRDIRDTLTVLLHEAAHGIGARRGIQNTSRNGCYHNKRYKALAEEVGLVVERVGSRGWTGTSCPDQTFDSYASTVVRLEKAIALWRKGDQANGRTPARTLALAVCQCDRKIRVAPTVYLEGPITCGRCGELFSVTAPIALASSQERS